MQFMIQNCSSLTSLNLSKFDTSIVTRMEYVFDGCEKLEYIILKNFNETKLNTLFNRAIQFIQLSCLGYVTNQLSIIDIRLKSNIIILIPLFYIILFLVYINFELKIKYYMNLLLLKINLNIMFWFKK